MQGEQEKEARQLREDLEEVTLAAWMARVSWDGDIINGSLSSSVFFFSLTLGRSSLVVAMSVTLCWICVVPPQCKTFWGPSLAVRSHDQCPYLSWVNRTPPHLTCGPKLRTQIVDPTHGTMALCLGALCYLPPHNITCWSPLLFSIPGIDLEPR